jgi:hypothetical protein
MQQIVMKRLLRGQMFRNSKDGRMGRKDDFFRLGLLSHYNVNFYKAVDCRKILVEGKIEEANKSVPQGMTAKHPESSSLVLC